MALSCGVITLLQFGSSLRCCICSDLSWGVPTIPVSAMSSYLSHLIEKLQSGDWVTLTPEMMATLFTVSKPILASLILVPPHCGTLVPKISFLFMWPYVCLGEVATKARYLQFKPFKSVLKSDLRGCFYLLHDLLWTLRIWEFPVSLIRTHCHSKLEHFGKSKVCIRDCILLQAGCLLHWWDCTRPLYQSEDIEGPRVSRQDYLLTKLIPILCYRVWSKNQQ